jgi:hypothetical protein
MVFWYVTPCGFTVRHDHCRHLTSPTPLVQVVITVATFRHVNRTVCLLLTAQYWLFEQDGLSTAYRAILFEQDGLSAAYRAVLVVRAVSYIYCVLFIELA